MFAKRTLIRLMREKRAPLIVALSGDLGSGKTTFSQGIAKALRIPGKIQSPTFVLMKWYDLGSGRYPYDTFIHIDAYRLESLRDALRLGFASLFRNRGAIIVIEWADRVRDLIPKTAIWIKFRHGVKHQRTIIISKP